MKCEFCNAVNDEDAVYCIYCGKRLDSKLICPSCKTENEEDSTFCKNCGTKLLKSKSEVTSEFKEKGLKLGDLILKIIALSMAAFIILFSFGACFSSFFVLAGKGAGLFDFIKLIKEFKPKPAGSYGADFYMLSKILPYAIGLCGVCIALLGCIAAIVYSGIKAICFGLKKKIPNLDNAGLLATCSLLLGVSFSGLLFVYSKSTGSLSLSGNYSMSYGSVVLAASIIGLAWYFINYIVRFVFDLIKGLTKKDILNRCFKLGETALLCIILFNLGSSFLTFVKVEEGISGLNLSTKSGMAVVDFFTELSGSIYSKTSDFTFIFITSDVAKGYYLAMAAFIIFLAIVVIGMILIFLRMRNKDKKKPTLAISISFVVMSFIELIYTLVAVAEFKKPEGVFQMLFGTDYEQYKVYLGASIIVFVIFSILLLALEITWMILSQKIKEPGEQAYEM